MEILNELLASMRLSGGVFLDGEMRGAWSILSHAGPEDCAPFFEAPSHIIAYHFVRSGWCSCQVGNTPPVPVRPGEIVLLPRNDPHILHGPTPAEPVDGHDLILPPENGGPFRIRHGDSGEETTIYCGFLGSTTPENMLLRSLPAIMVIAIEDAAESAWLRRSIDFAVQGVGLASPAMVGKLAEGLFAEAVRRYIEGLPPQATGWLAGLQDPAVGRAIALIHSRYAEALSLEAMACEARVSKTVLGERFRALLGESPMQYCARWRMHVAADMLRNSRQNACSVAYSVGFNSEAAFNRAFKREFGFPPAAWQRERAAPQPAAVT